MLGSLQLKLASFDDSDELYTLKLNALGNSFDPEMQCTSLNIDLDDFVSDIVVRFSDV